MTMDQLTLSEIGARLGADPQVLRKHARQPGFPEPTGRRGNARLYDLDAVQQWEDTRKSPAGTSQGDEDRLVTLQEAAEELGISYGSIRTYLGRHESFPKPVQRISNRPYFRLGEVRAWNARRARQLPTPSDTVVTEIDGLLTRAGVAAELGIEPKSVTRYVVGGIPQLRPFPEPARTIGRTRLWDRKAIREWGSHRS